MVVDSLGQLIEVTPDGQIVWQLKTGSYVTKHEQAPFFQAERISYMPPGFTVSSPVQHGSYPKTTFR